jgi:DMSO/TMAO reductase YedYZ molybdopterin-dependent catalytic subunit
MSTAAPHMPQVGLVIRERDPVNLEYPFEQLDSFLTPNELFYVRNHFEAPEIDLESYELMVGGAVQEPLAIRYRELRAMPAVTRPATIECAGNGRIFLVPQVKGAQWQLGAVSTAEWTGVPLTALLDQAGIDPRACEIVFEGADHGAPKEEPIPPGKTQYARSIPVTKALDVLIAYQMNGEDLSLDHGFPVRAIVPGHYGMASVKWLTHIHVLMDAFHGYWQTSDYGYWDYVDGNPVRVPLGPVHLKSAIARPSVRELVRAGSSYPVYGAAWAGDTHVAEVEVSTDGGLSWSRATLLDEAARFVWRRWSFAWQVPEAPGTYVLMSRAIDSEGRVQPDHHDPSYGTYVIDQTLRIEVTVR